MKNKSNLVCGLPLWKVTMFFRSSQLLTEICSRLGQLYQGRATLTVCSSRNLCQVQTVSCKIEVLCITNNCNWKRCCQGNSDFFFFPGDHLLYQIIYWSKRLSNEKPLDDISVFGTFFVAVLKPPTDSHKIKLSVYLALLQIFFRYPQFPECIIQFVGS